MAHKGPLSGIKVVDCTTLIAGPLATRILADQGADVIKIEPFGGDLVRHLGPTPAPNFSAAFLALGRNKRSVCMNLSDPAAQKLVMALVRDADVFIANSRPGVMARHGLDAKTLQDHNPRLIYVSITGNGDTGPMADQRTYDPIIQARSGMAAAQSGAQPVRLMPQMVCDKLTGLNTAQAVCAALLEAEKTGKGQRIDISLLSATLDFLSPDVFWTIATPGQDLPIADISNIYTPWDTRDGQIVFVVLADKEFVDLVEAFDCQFLAKDERFNTMAERFANWTDFQQIFKEKLAKLTTRDALQILKDANIPSGPVNRLTDLADDEQIAAIGAMGESQHAIAGRALQVKPAARFGNHSQDQFADAPELGQHTREVLSDLGLSDADIQKLFEAGTLV